jgi:hypothetical protein
VKSKRLAAFSEFRHFRDNEEPLFSSASSRKSERVDIWLSVCRVPARVYVAPSQRLAQVFPPPVDSSFVAFEFSCARREHTRRARSEPRHIGKPHLPLVVSVRPFLAMETSLRFDSRTKHLCLFAKEKFSNDDNYVLTVRVELQ